MNWIFSQWKKFFAFEKYVLLVFFSCFTNVWGSPKGEYLSLFSLWHLPSSLNFIFSIIDKNNHDKKVAFSPLKEEENYQCSFISQSGQKKINFKVIRINLLSYNRGRGFDTYTDWISMDRYNISFKEIYFTATVKLYNLIASKKEKFEQNNEQYMFFFASPRDLKMKIIFSASVYTRSSILMSKRSIDWIWFFLEIWLVGKFSWKKLFFSPITDIK